MALSKSHRLLSLGFPFEVLNRDLRLLFTCSLVGAFGDGLYSYLLPVYFGRSLGADSVQIGILYAVTSLFAALSLLVAGMVADKYDRKKIMIAGWIAWIPAPLIFSLSGNWLHALPGMVLWGIWLGTPASTAYIVAMADKTKLTLTFTMISAAWSFGYVFSPAIGGYLAGITGMQIVFYVASAFYTLSCLILLFTHSQRATDHERRYAEKRASFFELLRTRRLLVSSIIFALIMFILMMFRPFIPQFLSKVYQYGDFEIGILGSICFFGSALLGILLGRLGDKLRKRYAVAASMILCSVSLLLLVLFRHFLILAVAFFIIGGSYVTWSLIGAVLGPLAPEGSGARWVSVPQTVTMFSSFIAPYVGGVLYDSSAYYPMFAAAVGTALLAILTLSKLPDK